MASSKTLAVFDVTSPTERHSVQSTRLEQKRNHYIYLYDCNAYVCMLSVATRIYMYRILFSTNHTHHLRLSANNGTF